MSSLRGIQKLSYTYLGKLVSQKCCEERMRSTQSAQGQGGDEAGACGHLLNKGRGADCEHEPPGCRLCAIPAGQLLS